MSERERERVSEWRRVEILTIEEFQSVGLGFLGVDFINIMY